MSVRRNILLILGAAALGFMAQTSSAYAAVHPASADNCGWNGDNAVENCMYIDGSGLYASEIRGWASAPTGYPVHEEVTAPAAWAPDELLCDSPTISTSDPNTVVGCQLYNQTLPAGQYCAILWEYIGGEYVNEAENCVNVFA
jgi:hypothetical protein